MSSTDIEKKSLEAHVELCAERYAALDDKLDNLKKKVESLEEHIIVIKESLAGNGERHYRQLIAIGTTILGVLLAGTITLIVNFINK